MSESVILVEGYHDRAFCKGMLLHAGCSDPAAAGGTSAIRVVDDAGKPVKGGQYGFRSQSGTFVRLVPCNGADGVLRELRIRLDGRLTRPVDQLIVCLDADVDAGHATGTATRVHDVLRRHEPAASPNAAGVVGLSDGTRVTPVIWHADDPPSDLLPKQQCLERLVVASLAQAYPDRAAAVRDWLRSRPSPPADNPKAHAWSHMAGWYSGLGCDAFLTQVWGDPPVAAAIGERLRRAGLWHVVRSIAA